MSDLPKERLLCDQPPFTNVGVDCFGPFKVKRGRSDVKRWGVIFTCLVSRAVHIEIADDLSTDSFIMALRRFISRRGQVKIIWSDNGTNFVGAVNELKKNISIWNQSQINTFLLQKEIKWVFNPPAASHFGGVWKRLIRSVRQILMGLTTEQKLTEEGLHTLMCEAEAIINSRPLTIVSNDWRDPNPISPNDLLLLKSNYELPPGVFQKCDVYSKRRWRQVQFLSNVFWSRFKSEYVTLLQKRQKWLKLNDDFKINNVVIVSNPSLPRNNWNLGKIIKTFPDESGVIRKVEVKTKDGILLRPISKLCLLLPTAENL